MSGKPGRIEGRLQKQALGRLSELMEQAERQGLYGRVGVFVDFENGVPKVIRHLIDATNK